MIYAADLLRARRPSDGACNTALIETTLHEIEEVFDALEINVFVNKFSLMEPDEVLMQHVKRLVAAPDFFESDIGPSSETCLVYKTPLNSMPQMKTMTLEQAAKWISAGWRNVAAFKKEWRTMCKSIASGVYSPLISRGVHFGNAGEFESFGSLRIFWPIVLREPDGKRWWGLMGHQCKMTDDFRLSWSLPDILTVKHTSSFISVVDTVQGRMLWQNAASTELYGCHGRLNSQLDPTDSTGSKYNFIELIFGPNQPSRDESGSSIQANMRSITSKGGTFRATLEVSDPTLRSLINLGDEEEMHLDVQVSQTCDPSSLQKVYVISQIDVTSQVMSQRELEKTRERLEVEKAKTESLLLRQRELIECLSWVGEVGSSAGGDARARDLIDSIRKQLTTTMDEGRSNSVSSSGIDEIPATLDDAIKIDKLIGQGSYGQVFRGTWRDIPVAVKSMILPVQMSGAQKKERMALMEAAISSSLSHPNIIKTHTYSIRPVREITSGSQLSSKQLSLKSPGMSAGVSNQSFERSKSIVIQGPVSAFEVKIVLEYCDKGSLLDSLNAGTFHSGFAPNYTAILEVASDIAEGMRHLHSCHIIHADLKPSNILLQSSSEPKGVTAKIADFGLSISKVDAEQTHVSNIYQGTVSYMSPECLSTGQQSNAGDVYSFGIMLYELYSRSKAYNNIPLTFLGHKVSQDHLRPIFPPGTTPLGFKQLAEACWDPIAANRPTFEAIISTLGHLKESAPNEASHLLSIPPCTASLNIPMPSKISFDSADPVDDMVSYQAEGLRIQDSTTSVPEGVVLTPIDESTIDVRYNNYMSMRRK